jgi:hypothetical protein
VNSLSEFRMKTYLDRPADTVSVTSADEPDGFVAELVAGHGQSCTASIRAIS